MYKRLSHEDDEPHRVQEVYPDIRGLLVRSESDSDLL